MFNFLESEATSMKATGIVRRIDDLGRVVVPKEIRRTLRIREGDPLEIFTGREGEVILKKYSPIAELGQFAQAYAEALYEALGTPILISDCDEVIAVSGISKKEYHQKPLSSYAETIIAERKMINEQYEKEIELVQGQVELVKSYCISPIIAASDTVGAIYALSKIHFIGEIEEKTIETAALFLAKQME